jgi:hypothetical protein
VQPQHTGSKRPVAHRLFALEVLPNSVVKTH